MIVAISQDNEKGEHIMTHYVGVVRIARGIVADDLILYFKDVENAGRFFPYDNYRVEHVDGSIKIENATIHAVDMEGA